RPVQHGRVRRLGRDQRARPLQTARRQGQPAPARQGQDVDPRDASAHWTSFPVATSNFLVFFLPLMVSVLPSCEYDRSPPRPVLKVRISLPVAASSRFSVPSLSSDASVLPSGE